MTARLRMTGLEKRFGATRALRGVSLEVGAGSVHALIGENGAGKSTLMKILSGACPPDAGSITLDGESFTSKDPLHARRSGIAMIYQELNLAPHLSVEENLLLGEEPCRFGWINRKARQEKARSALADLQHSDIPLKAPVNALTIAQQQVVEIARALVGRPKVLIMDEPTSSLTKADTEKLFQVIQRLRDRGVSVIYISHFLEECQSVCDRYTVLRDGESVGGGEMKSAKMAEIIRMMVGRELSEIYPRTPHEIGEPVFELRGVSGYPKPGSVSLTLRRGEILGLAGLVGAGRTETLRACFGLDRLAGGSVLVRGCDGGSATPGSRLAEGVGMVSEDRKLEGLMLNRSIADNLTITRFKPVSSAGIIRRSKQIAAAENWMRELDVRARGAGQCIGELSGGNQQKIAIGRLLHHEAEVLLLDEPTRGVDVGSKSQIYRLIGQLAAQGKAVVMASSYLPELLGVCDTVGVMCRGVLSQVRPVADWTEHSIMAAAIGQDAN